VSLHCNKANEKKENKREQKAAKKGTKVRGSKQGISFSNKKYKQKQQEK
jgi:hypothetical protein